MLELVIHHYRVQWKMCIRDSLELKDDGAYRIYQLEKRHWNTMDALLAIARQNKMPMAKIGYGGRKDRHAVTYQYISVPRQYDLSFNMSNILSLIHI